MWRSRGDIWVEQVKEVPAASDDVCLAALALKSSRQEGGVRVQIAAYLGSE